MEDKHNNVAAEVLQDLITMYLCFETQEKIKNPFVQEMYGYVMVYFYSVFLHELFQADLVDETKNCKSIKKLVNQLRQRFLKEKALVDAKLTKKIFEEMGIDFHHYTYDLVITTDKKNQRRLYSINYGLWDIENIGEDQVRVFNTNAHFPKNFIKELLYLWDDKTLAEQIFLKFEEHCEKKAQEVENEIEPEKYPYPSGILFKNDKLSDQDKIIILYYYSYFLLFSIVNELVPPLRFKFGEVSIDISHSIMKLKAMLIASFGENIKDIDTLMVARLKKKMDESFGKSDVFKLNRKLRDNIHYKKTDNINEGDWIKIDMFQRKYFKIVLDEFHENIQYKIGKRYRLIKWIADHTDTTMRAQKKEAKKNKLTIPNI